MCSPASGGEAYCVTVPPSVPVPVPDAGIIGTPLTLVLVPVLGIAGVVLGVVLDHQMAKRTNTTTIMPNAHHPAALEFIGM